MPPARIRPVRRFQAAQIAALDGGALCKVLIGTSVSAWNTGAPQR